jgi:signal transduction histidine kinase
MALRNWRVRSRLLLLITIPTLTAVVLGGFRIVDSVQSALAYQRVEKLANLSLDITSLAATLENERDVTASYIAAGLNGGRAAAQSKNKVTKASAAALLQTVTEDYQLSKPWVARVRGEVAGIGSGYPAQVQQDASAITAVLGTLTDLRNAATKTQLPMIDMVQKYTTLIDQVLAIDGDLSIGNGDPSLTETARALGLVSEIAEQASEQRAYLAYAFTREAFPAGILPALVDAETNMNASIKQYQTDATPQQIALYNNVVSGGLVDFANEEEAQAIIFGQSGKNLNITTTTADDWFGDMSGEIDDMHLVEHRLARDAVSRASALRGQAIFDASATGLAVFLVLAIALLLTTMVGRSMVRPLRRLRAGALEVAGIRLPETVRRMSDTDGTGVPLEVEPIGVDSADEIGEVARAFDQVHREALRLASNEAALRGNVNAMFVNLSRRSQSLVERQIRLIDDLEQGEQDSDRLASLFQMDHLATRMRRNSENLLVLAGHEATRRWNQPVALVDVLRAAVSEIEQYERVTLNVQPGIAVRGHAVNDVVHLLAELAENATAFSSAETPVTVAGHLLSSGGVLLDITDHGVGMGAEEMAHANWRLDNPPVVDVAVSRRMGLFVVARLAARHGIRVRLRPAAAGGLTALVWLPDEVVSHQGTSPGGFRRVDGASGSQELPAGVAGMTSGERPILSTGDRLALSTGERPTTAQEVDAARAPKFASLGAESEQVGPLGPRRVPGAGPRPGAGSWPAGPTSTGPLPSFRSSPQPADGFQDGEPGTNGPASGPFGTGPLPVVRDDPFGTGPQPVVGADQQGTIQQPMTMPASPVSPLSIPPSAEAADLAAGAGQAAAAASANGPSSRGPLSWGNGDSSDGIVLPAADHVATENRLPIFEAVESDWFRRGRSALSSWQEQDHDHDHAETAESVNWTSPADEGWQAAAAASAPASGGTTEAGLPKRVPQANLVPGAVATETQEADPAPARSAAVTRDRFANFQRGAREGRAAALSQDDEAGGDGDGSPR